MDMYNKILERICFFIVISVFCFPLNIRADKSAEPIQNRFNHLTITELFEKGQTCYKEGKKDSALIFFSLCETRDVESASQEE